MQGVRPDEPVGNRATAVPNPRGTSHSLTPNPSTWRIQRVQIVNFLLLSKLLPAGAPISNALTMPLRHNGRVVMSHYAAR